MSLVIPSTSYPASAFLESSSTRASVIDSPLAVLP